MPVRWIDEPPARSALAILSRGQPTKRSNQEQDRQKRQDAEQSECAGTLELGENLDYHHRRIISVSRAALASRPPIGYTFPASLPGGFATATIVCETHG
jgi:hypothetical protein